MKDYKNVSCIEVESSSEVGGGFDYFNCLETVSPIIEKEQKESIDIIPQDLPLSTDNYKKSAVSKRSYKLYEK